MTIANIKLAMSITVAVTLVSTSSASAVSPITYDFAGTLTRVTGTDLVSVGDSFSGRFTYDANTPDSDFFYPELGWYEQRDLSAVSGFIVQFGGVFSYELEQDGRLVLITALNRQFMNDKVGVEFLNESGTIPAFPSANFIGGGLDLWGPAGTLNSDSIVTLPVLTDFSLRRLFYMQGRVNGSNETIVFTLEGELTSLTIVPEPATTWSAAIGLLIMVRSRRQRLTPLRGAKH